MAEVYWTLMDKHEFKQAHSGRNGVHAHMIGESINWHQLDQLWLCS